MPSSQVELQALLDNWPENQPGTLEHTFSLAVGLMIKQVLFFLALAYTWEH
jgi:hypothetical protein